MVVKKGRLFLAKKEIKKVDKKYKLGEKHRSLDLYRVVALRDFGDVKAGEIGGWIESENNLSHEGNSWVYDNARVSGNASVSGDACVFGNASVYDIAWVYGNTSVYDKARVAGNARVSSGNHTMQAS